MRNPVYSLTKRVARLLPGPAVFRRRGARLLLDPRNWIDNRLIAGAPFENDQLAFARQLLSEHSIDTVIDIGANIGLYSVLLGLRPEIKAVHAFEPVRRNHAQLMANLYLNRLTDVVTAHRLALGVEAGAAVIHIDPRSTGVSRLNLATSERNSDAFSETETIEIARFDEVVALAGRRVFVKIDVEGGAADVLAGMQRFIARNTIAFQIEVSTAEAQPVAAIMQASGYREHRRIEGDTIYLPATCFESAPAS